jgi:cellulose synthase/poly-beta-1,6-N-acetylglucosamine synthase-like glycosyltransferase
MDMENILFFISLGILIYMIILNAFYSLNLLMAAIILPVYNKRYFFTKGINIDKNISKSFSILVPAYNEEKTIVDSVNSLLSLDYKNYEVVVANDGSKDKTLDILISTFEFVKVDVRPNDACESKPIKAVYFSRTEPKLVLVDKENGGKPDAQNGAARVARFPYICMVDADTLLDKESLNDLAIRFAAEPNIVALGGIIRVANGCTIENGIVTNAGMPHRFIEKIQVLEYLRAFLFGRVSLTAMKALMIISGAFGVFRWDAFMLLHGWNREAIGEDMDAVIRLQRIISEKKLNWKVDFAPDPVSWTQVPMTWKSLGHQRERWQRGLMQVMLGNLKMLLNPRYGAVGLVGFPYFAIFEMLSAAVEFLCYPLTIMCFAFGIVNVTYMVYFLCLVLVWGLCISFFTILVQEDIKYRYGTARDLKALLCIAVFENFGYRQIHSFWRLWGMMKYIFVKSSRSSGLSGWTSIQRASFTE